METVKRNKIEKIIAVISVCMMAFQLFTAAYMPLTELRQRTLHLGFVFIIAFLLQAIAAKKKFVKVLYIVLGIIGFSSNIYLFCQSEKIAYRMTALNIWDEIFAVALIALLLFITYKLIGIWMPLLAGAFIVYGLFGHNLQGIFHFKEISISRYLSVLYANYNEGIFGTCLAVSATFVFMFVLFGEVMSAYGAGEFIIDITESIFGRFRGGSPKIAVIASALFGMISGSGPANVAGTGTFTIPLMKKTGFEPHYAGAVEATASTGGQFMPPIMGAAAFILAEIVGTPYREVCLRAIIPAVLFYVALFITVDLHAGKLGGLKMKKEELPSTKAVFKKGWHNLVSILLLVYLLCFKRMSASLSCFWAVIALIACYYVRALIERQKINVKEELQRLLKICEGTAKGIMTTAIACACAGIIVGTLSATGLTLRLSNILIELANGNVILLVVLAMVGCLVLGMGIPPLPVYIVAGILLAPALSSLGLNTLASHMFLLFFGCLANITPPVGVSFYVAAGIAEASPMKTGFTAWRLALPGFIIPYIFIFNNSLLLMGPALGVIQVVASTLIGILCLAFGFEGFLYGVGKLPMVSRGIFLVAGICACIPETITDVVGIALIVCAVLIGLFYKKANANKVVAE